MKSHSLFLFVLICFSTSMWGQKDQSPFLFKEFQDATVHFKGGTQSKEKMNYDLIGENFCFVDQKDDLVKVIAKPEAIHVVKIGDRVFYPERVGAVEILPTKPTIYVQYKVKAKAEGPKGAYGGSTETASVTSYGSIYANGGTYNLEQLAKVRILGRYNIYWIEKNDKKQQFRTFKQFVKLYPEHKEELNLYIKEKDLKIDDVDKVVKLCLYAEGLQEKH